MPPRYCGTSSNKFIGGSLLQKELQGIAAFSAYAEIHRRGDSVTHAMQYSMIGELYFGNPSDPDSIGSAEQLVKGLGVFRGLYATLSDDEALAYNQQGAGVTDKNVHSGLLVLKPELHCLGPLTTILSTGRSRDGISLPLLHQKSLAGDEKVAPRTLLNRAKESAKNCRKVLSHVMDDLSPYKDFLESGNLPSGMQFEDYLLYVRQKMWEDGQQSNPSIDNKSNEEQQNQHVVADVSDTIYPDNTNIPTNNDFDR